MINNSQLTYVFLLACDTILMSFLLRSDLSLSDDLRIQNRSYLLRNNWSQILPVYFSAPKTPPPEKRWMHLMFVTATVWTVSFTSSEKLLYFHSVLHFLHKYVHQFHKFKSYELGKYYTITEGSQHFSLLYLIILTLNHNLNYLTVFT